MTAYERTGWRDQAISKRHRDWGFNCPAVDLDFLMVEYNIGEPAALVEYKLFSARMPDLRHATYRALESLANRLPPIPFMIAFYWPVAWAFRVHPVNDMAMALYGPDHVDLTEREFVESLYRARGWAIQEHTLRRLNTITVAEAEKEVEALF